MGWGLVGCVVLSVAVFGGLDVCGSVHDVKACPIGGLFCGVLVRQVCNVGDVARLFEVCG